MFVSLEKKQEVWDYAMLMPKKCRPNGVTEIRLRSIKDSIFHDDDFWEDIVWRHGLITRSPIELKGHCEDTYEHCFGNFWGMTASKMYQIGAIPIKQ